MMLKLKWKALDVGSVSLDYAKQLSLSLSLCSDEKLEQKDDDHDGG